ncbi:MAG TPA: response regulator transcription factor [Actinomycetes bacterium]|jgi:DNA-binding NarL/FixJ family response regulator|nr:response regulator transcription factor [Actinomycetes bacterium]
MASVLIVDDHMGFRARARALLEALGHHVVGEAADGAAAISAVGRLRPEVVLLDVQLPDLDGFEVARRVAEEPEAPAVVLVSSRELVEFGRRVADSGVRGFISKVDLSGVTLQAVLSGGL